MREMAIDLLKPGMRLSQQVNSPDDKITLGQGTILTEAWITKLRQWGRRSVRIDTKYKPDDTMRDIEILLQEVFSVIQIGEDGMGTVKNKMPSQVFEETYHQVEGQLRRVYLAARCGSSLQVAELERLAKTLIYPLVDMPEAFLYLHEHDRSDNYLYRHSLDVALLAGFMGRWVGYSDTEVQELVYAGLIHDIGKCRVFFDIIAKPAELSEPEMELARVHVRHGYQMLSDNTLIPGKVLKGVIQHHERLDGTGYPLGLKAPAISPFGRILAIADVYDALISNRYYGRGVSPMEAIYIMMYEIQGKLDFHVLGVFIEQLRKRFTGAFVELSTGSLAQVVAFPAFPQIQPVVMLEDGSNLDLSSRSDITIIKMKPF